MERWAIIRLCYIPSGYLQTQVPLALRKLTFLPQKHFWALQQAWAGGHHQDVGNRCSYFSLTGQRSSLQLIYSAFFFIWQHRTLLKLSFFHIIIIRFCQIYCFIMQHNVKDIFRNCVKQKKTDVLVNWFSPNWCGWLVAENPTWRIMLAESGILFCLSSAIFSQHS